MLSVVKPTEINVNWQGHRIIPSRFPPISVFERVVDAADLDEAFFIESLTNDRIREEAGDLTLIPAEDRISGPGTSPVMAAFTHIGHPSRFTDGTYGVYYAGVDSKTAIAETKHHRAKFLAATNEPDTQISMREYIGNIVLPMLDITDNNFIHLHDPDDYRQSQKFAKETRDRGYAGLLYNSVRNAGGLCVAAFKPKALSPVIQAAHYEYYYSASERKIIHVYEMRELI